MERHRGNRKGAAIHDRDDSDEDEEEDDDAVIDLDTAAPGTALRENAVAAMAGDRAVLPRPRVGPRPDVRGTRTLDDDKDAGEVAERKARAAPRVAPRAAAMPKNISTTARRAKRPVADGKGRFCFVRARRSRWRRFGCNRGVRVIVSLGSFIPELEGESLWRLELILKWCRPPLAWLPGTWPGTDIGLPIGQFRCVTALLFPLRDRVLLGTSSGPTCPPAGTLARRTTRKSSVNAFAGAWPPGRAA